MIVNGTKIKVLLVEQNISMKSFCEKNNIPYSTMNEIVNGNRSPRLCTLSSIAEALKVKVSDIIIEK